MTCSPTVALRMANRIWPSVPIRGVRNMYGEAPEPDPKSKRRCQAPPALEKLAHVAKVDSPSVLRSEPIGSVTKSSVPSNCNAPPSCPAVHTGSPVRTPSLPPADESAAVVPAVSSSFHQPTGSGVAAAARAEPKSTRTLAR